MREDSRISLYRDRLDKTLSSQDLTNAETLGILVKDQILRSSKLENEDFVDKIVEMRTNEVSHFLGMLRSASMDDVQRSKYSETSHRGWKVKQDTEEFRVMYREGPEGTPFHTLLVEGYVDGPLDVCLCISWEASLYPKCPISRVNNTIFADMFNQVAPDYRSKFQDYLFPVSAKGRMKLSWPLSTREALIHCFEFEYLEDDLVVVLLNSISDLESIDVSTHGFSRDGIPDAQDVIRMDVVGGFALQKVSANRSYFRTITNMDVKLNFVPPAFINFVSRQIIGSGFKLYKKEVASVAKGDEDFAKALKDPLYDRIGQPLYSNGLCAGAPQQEDVNNTSFLVEEQPQGNNEVRSIPEMVHDHLAINSHGGDSFVQDKKSHGEIEEIKENDSKESQCLAELDDSDSCNLLKNEIETGFCTDNKKVVIRPEVEQALRILDEVICVFQECRSNDETRTLAGILNEDSQNLENNDAKESISSEADRVCRNAVASSRPTEMFASHEPRKSSGSQGSRDANHNKIAPASPHEGVSDPHEIDHTGSFSSQNQITELTLAEKTSKDDNIVSADASVVGGNKGRSRNRRTRFCCFSSVSWQLSA